MSIIRKKVRFKFENVNIKFPIGNTDDFVGLQQEIDSQTQFTTNELINPTNDAEVTRFVFKPYTGTQTLRFYFQLSSGGYNNTFVNGGFTQSEINDSAENFVKSFFILELFDTFDIGTQNKICTMYLSNIGTTPIYTINQSNINEFYRWNIPKSFVNLQSNTTITAYVKFSFYNAKSDDNGGIRLFYGINRNLNTSERMFTPVNLDLFNKTWRFNTPSTLSLFEMRNDQLTYKEKINNTFEKFDNIKQEFPDGNTFDDDGGYSTT